MQNRRAWARFCREHMHKSLCYRPKIKSPYAYRCVCPAITNVLLSHLTYNQFGENAMNRKLALIAALFCALAYGVAFAETIDVSDNHGGDTSVYQQKWAALSKHGANVRIVGSCISACTILLRYFSGSRICVTPAAALGFHRGRDDRSMARMWGAYSPALRRWIEQQGGLPQNHAFIWLRAPEIYRFFHKC